MRDLYSNIQCYKKFNFHIEQPTQYKRVKWWKKLFADRIQFHWKYLFNLISSALSIQHEHIRRDEREEKLKAQIINWNFDCSLLIRNIHTFIHMLKYNRTESSSWFKLMQI